MNKTSKILLRTIIFSISYYFLTLLVGRIYYINDPNRKKVSASIQSIDLMLYLVNLFFILTPIYFLIRIIISIKNKSLGSIKGYMFSLVYILLIWILYQKLG
jgi:hypothetical protein